MVNNVLFSSALLALVMLILHWVTLRQLRSIYFLGLCAGVLPSRLWWAQISTLISLKYDFFSQYEVSGLVSSTFAVVSLLLAVGVHLTWVMLSRHRNLIWVFVRVGSLLLLNFSFKNHREVIISNSAWTHSRLLHIRMDASFGRLDISTSVSESL